MIEPLGLQKVDVHYHTHHSNVEDRTTSLALNIIRGELIDLLHSESCSGTLRTDKADWASNFAALKEINYSGWLVIEAFGTSDTALTGVANVRGNCHRWNFGVIKRTAKCFADSGTCC